MRAAPTRKKAAKLERVAATRQKAADCLQRITGDEESHRRPDWQSITDFTQNTE